MDIKNFDTVILERRSKILSLTVKIIAGLWYLYLTLMLLIIGGMGGGDLYLLFMLVSLAGFYFLIKFSPENIKYIYFSILSSTALFLFGLFPLIFYEVARNNVTLGIAATLLSVITLQFILLTVFKKKLSPLKRTPFLFIPIIMLVIFFISLSVYFNLGIIIFLSN